MSGDPEQEYFSDGISEDIITDLSKLSELHVIARNSSFSYKGRSVDVKQVGRELSVRYVLEGSVRKAGNRIRVTGQLIDAESGAHIWAERFDRDLTDIFAVQDELTQEIIAALKIKLSKTERALIRRRHQKCKCSRLFLERSRVVACQQKRSRDVRTVNRLFPQGH
jgi:adenylate cyclase